jgi:hypothetical protein
MSFLVSSPTVPCLSKAACAVQHSQTLMCVLQFVELSVGEDAKEFAGIPFVLNSGRTWYKDMGVDFWVGIKKAELAPQKVKCSTH